ncbi:hypothetical protein D0Y65_015492, partial [Glycine soja]
MVSKVWSFDGGFNGEEEEGNSNSLAFLYTRWDQFSKYINKGYDTVTTVMVHDANDAIQHPTTQNDEIKEYLDSRYISPCEATWRIFGFPIHGRKPDVERLHFHLLGQHSVLYQDHDDIDDVLSKPSISDSKFISWMNNNQCTINKPEELWDQTWHWLANDIVYHYRKSTANTDQQTSIYNQIIQAINKNEGGMFFLYGYGGTRKTFIWKTLASSLRADKKIVIMVASSGIASLLFPRGRTAHSKFKIPVPIFEDSTCNIHQGSQLAELLNQTSLIIWDEAPMAHKFCFEALDQSLRDIIKGKSSSNKIFGGKVMVFGGDFRQILPVIPRGNRSDIVNATINSSYLWDYCQVLTLTKNMRLQSNIQAVDEQETATFAQWIVDIGDGIIGHQNDGYATVKILKDVLITEYDDPIHVIVNSTFPNLCYHHNNPEFFRSRAILASTNETVQQVNDYILSLIPEFAHFKYARGIYQIRVRQHRGKFFFADGLRDFRRELNIYESTTINFYACDHNWKLLASVVLHVDAYGQHMTILIRRFGPPLQWNVVVLDTGIGDKYIVQLWYQFLMDNDFSHGDEVIFYY